MLKLDEYLYKFKFICDNLTVLETDKLFKLARGLGPKYYDLKTVMLSKPPCPTLNQFILSLQKLWTNDYYNKGGREHWTRP